MVFGTLENTHNKIKDRLSEERKMKNIEKVLTVLVCSAMAFLVFGCSDKKSGSGRSSRDDDKATEEVEDKDVEETDETKKADDESEKATEAEEFTGYTDLNIKALAESYEAAGLTVIPVMASDLGAGDYNYVEGFRMFKEGEEDTFMCFVKFKSSDDAASFVKDVWIADCKGYIFHEIKGMYDFSIDELYYGGIDNSGLMQYAPWQGDSHENTAKPEDFKDPQIVELYNEYLNKGFLIESMISYDGFTAYGINADRAHIFVVCLKFKDKDAAIEYLDESYGSMSMMTKDYKDNADGSVSFVFDCDPQYIRTVPMEGTVSADGLIIMQYPA